MRVKEAVDEYHFALLDKSPKTQDWFRIKLRQFSEWCEQEQLELQDIRSAHVRKYIDYRRQQGRIKQGKPTGEPLSTHSLHADARVIKRFLYWCAKEDGIEDLVQMRVPQRIEMPKREEKVIEVFTPEQIKALLAACEKEKDHHLAVRDKAIVLVLMDTGIRAGELLSLTKDCMFLRLDDAYLKVHGKGNKWREVPLGNQARTALYRYVTRYRQAPDQEQHVFVGRWGRQMTVNGLDQMLRRLAEWGRVTGVRVSAHTFRHTFAVNYLTASSDVYKLSRLMGHSEVKITEGYLKTVSAHAARHFYCGYDAEWKSEEMVALDFPRKSSYACCITR